MFLSISLPLSWNLTPSLSYHNIVRKRIAKVTDFLSFCPFGISIFPFLTIGISMYQKRILPYFIIPYFLTPSFFPFGALRTDRRTDFNTPCYLSSFFFSTERAGPYPQAHLYWAGRTMGWMADWTREPWPYLADFADFDTTISNSFLGQISYLRRGNPLRASAPGTQWTSFASAAWGCSFLLGAF
jgi:hypothetical protein